MFKWERTSSGHQVPTKKRNSWGWKTTKIEDKFLSIRGSWWNPKMGSSNKEEIGKGSSRRQDKKYKNVKYYKKSSHMKKYVEKRHKLEYLVWILK